MKQTRITKKAASKKKMVAQKTVRLNSRSAEVVRKRASMVGDSVKGEVQYVLPLGNGWVVKGSNTRVFTAISDSKREAISIARKLAKTKHTHLVVHGKGGTVEIRESYI